MFVFCLRDLRNSKNVPLRVLWKHLSHYCDLDLWPMDKIDLSDLHKGEQVEYSSLKRPCSVSVVLGLLHFDVYFGPVRRRTSDHRHSRFPVQLNGVNKDGMVCSLSMVLTLKRTIGIYQKEYRGSSPIPGFRHSFVPQTVWRIISRDTDRMECL